MHDHFAILIISSGRIIYFREMIQSLSLSGIYLTNIKIYLMLNGEGRKRLNLYKDVLESLAVDYEIKLIEGVKHSEIIKAGLQETINFEHVLLCEDDWIFSQDLGSEDLEFMCKRSSEFRQVCFSNEERIPEITTKAHQDVYFTLNPSVISRNARLRILETYNWDSDKSILDELEKNLAKLFDDVGGLYLFESNKFLVRHIGIFSTRHYLRIYRKLGFAGELLILFISKNLVLKFCYQFFVRISQRFLLGASKILH